MMQRLQQENGFVLVAVTATALLCSVAAVGVLYLAVTQGRQAGFYEGRTEGRYLAEAGLVLAQQKLMADPAYCPGGACVPGSACTGTQKVDTNFDGDMLDPDDASVTITVTNCGVGRPHAISAKALY